MKKNINEKENKKNKFENITVESMKEKILLYTENQLAPIEITTNSGKVIEVLEMINSVNNASGRSYLNIFDTAGKFSIVNEDFVEDIYFNETTQKHYDDFNRLMNQSKMMRNAEEQIGIDKQENMFR